MQLPIAMIGMQEILVFGAIVLLLFGGAKIPQLMRGLGKGMGEFQRGIEEGKKALEKAKREAMAAGEDGDESKESS